MVRGLLHSPETGGARWGPWKYRWDHWGRAVGVSLSLSVRQTNRREYPERASNFGCYIDSRKTSLNGSKLKMSSTINLSKWITEMKGKPEGSRAKGTLYSVTTSGRSGGGVGGETELPLLGSCYPMWLWPLHFPARDLDLSCSKW